MRIRIAVGVLVMLGVMSGSPNVLAAQIVAMDVEAGGGVPTRLAQALRGILLEELGRRDGVSIVSQADVRALLELESNKQALGCTDTSCMTEIAGSLGAELLLRTTLNRVGRDYVASLTLIQVESAKVVRRASGKATGPEEVATEAMAAAVHNLFRSGLPTELLGPASMTRRGFKAALAGFFAAVLDRAQDPLPSRKRIILDLINTELDYDAKPKMDTLDLNIRRSVSRLETLMLMASDPAELEHLIRGREHFWALGDDLGRVKEIRERARARGVVPSARPLRFMRPEIGKRPDPQLVKKYRASSEGPRNIVSKALKAYLREDSKAFTSYFDKDHKRGAQRDLPNDRKYDRRNKYTYDLLPVHAMPPRLYRSIESAIESKKMIVYLRKFRKGAIYGEKRVYLEKLGGRWQITSW